MKDEIVLKRLEKELSELEEKTVLYFQGLDEDKLNKQRTIRNKVFAIKKKVEKQFDMLENEEKRMIAFITDMKEKRMNKINELKEKIESIKNK